jgi:hypothetical protein
MHFAAILLILGGLLSGLIVVAVVQRRGSETLAGPGFYMNGPQSPFDTTEGGVEYDKPTWTLISIGRIAVGVWLGLWLFVFTAAIPAFIIITRLAKSGL